MCEEYNLKKYELICWIREQRFSSNLLREQIVEADCLFLDVSFQNCFKLLGVIFYSIFRNELSQNEASFRKNQNF